MYVQAVELISLNVMPSLLTPSMVHTSAVINEGRNSEETLAAYNSCKTTRIFRVMEQRNVGGALAFIRHYEVMVLANIIVSCYFMST